MNNQPYNKNLDPKRNKYGFRTLATILNALSSFTIREDGLKREIAIRGAIDIGRKYISHNSAKIRVSASFFYGLIVDDLIGLEFRKNNDCLVIFKEALPIPTLKII